MVEFLPPSPADTMVKGKEDNEKVAAMINKIAAKGGAENFIQMRRFHRVHQQKYITMVKMFMEASDVTKLLEVRSEGGGKTGNSLDIHWELLQVDHMNL